MADKNPGKVLFASGAVVALASWVALVAIFATTVPTDDRRAIAQPKIVQAIKSTTHIDLPRMAGLGLAGPSSADVRSANVIIAPSFTHLRISKTQGRGLFAGLGEPYARVVLLRSGRTVADTRADDTGTWQIATAITSVAGNHTFSLEQRNQGRPGYTVGENIHLTVPEGFHQTIDLTTPPKPDGFRMVAVRADGDDIGSASSRRFDQFFQEGAGNGQVDQPTNQRARASREIAKGNDVLEPAWNWLRDANRSYNREIVPRIKRGGGFDRDDNNDRRRQLSPLRETENRDARVATRDGDTNRRNSSGGGLVSGVTDWFKAARRGYNSEIVPRLSGEVPSVIVARPRNEQARGETDAERLRREERLREANAKAVRKAEQERLDAERRRREAEQRRKLAQAEAERIAQENRQLAEVRRREQAEEQSKIEAERRRALERREKEQERLAEANRRAKSGVAGQRAAELEAERERQKRQAADAEFERRRVARLEQERERAEERRRQEAVAAEEARARIDRERRLEQERRQERLMAEAETLKRRTAEAERKAREEDLREQREREEARRRRMAEATPRNVQRNRFWRDEETRTPMLRDDRNRTGTTEHTRRRDTIIEFNPIRRDETERGVQPSSPKRYVQRNTTIEFNSGSNTDVEDRKPANKRYRELLRSSAEKKQAVVKRKRRRRVGSYRRRMARSRCRGKAGRTISTPGTYVVTRGDSLWKISRRHYRLGRLYPRIHNANRDKIRIPRLIYPCQRFHLPGKRS